jgi:hypothetical protein
MRILEKALCILAMMCLWLMLIFNPAGELLFALSFFLMGIFYLLFSFALLHGIRFRKMFNRASYEGISAGAIPKAALVGIALFIACFAVLFSALMWIGGTLLLYGSILFLAPVTIVSGMRLKGADAPYNKRLFTRALPMLVLCLLFVFGLRHRALRIMYSNHPDFVNAVERTWRQPRDEQAREVMQAEFRKMRGR